jgi:hypothetical protein
MALRLFADIHISMIDATSALIRSAGTQRSSQAVLLDKVNPPTKTPTL